MPDEVKEALRIPTKFPSEPFLDVTVNLPQGDIIMVLTHIFGDEGKWNVMVHTYPNGDGVGEEMENSEKIKLDNGTEVEYYIDEDEKIHFFNGTKKAEFFILYN